MMDMGFLGGCSVYVFLELKPCSLTDRFQHFGSTHCLSTGYKKWASLKDGGNWFVKTLVFIYWATECHIPEDHTALVNIFIY